MSRGGGVDVGQLGLSVEERARHIEKAARALSQIRQGEGLRGHTRGAEEAVDGRRWLVQCAVQGDWARVRVLLSGDIGGVKTLLRALKNLQRVTTEAALGLATLLLELLATQVDEATQAKALALLVRGVDGLTMAEVAPLMDLGESLVRGKWEDRTGLRTWLWTELVAMDLRLDGDSDRLIRRWGPLRERHLSRESVRRLSGMMGDSAEAWSRRGAAVYALVAADGLSVDEAVAFVDASFGVFPLEALVAVEHLGRAIDYDAGVLAEQAVVMERLLHFRAESLPLEKVGGEALRSAMGRVVELAQAGELEVSPAAVEIAGSGAEKWVAAALMDAQHGTSLARRLWSLSLLEPLLREWLASPVVVEHPLLRGLLTEMLGVFQAEAGRFAKVVSSWQDAVASECVAAMQAVAGTFLQALAQP